MSNYVYGSQQITFGSRDGLAPGNAEKVVKGVQLDQEFTRLATVSNEKLDKTGGDFSGTINGGTVNGGTY